MRATNREAYDLEFLIGKGFFRNKVEMKDEDLDGREVGYLYDPDNNLALFRYTTDDEIRKILRVVKNVRNYEYYWFWGDERVCAHRIYGENKWFIHNITYRRIDEYRKSKLDKLKRFGPGNMEVLFDVKDVIDTFYKNLWDIRIKMAKSIPNDISDQERLLAAQRIIDRLIFVYFIGQKGLLKVVDDMGREIEFDIKKLFEHITKTYAKESKRFFRFINRLFFDFLNSEKNDHLRVEGTKGYSIKVPFLNGGLFREYDMETESGGRLRESNLDVQYNWNELIDELNKYNWLIGDYLPTEEGYVIGNLTPEILGHIYERFVIAISGLDEIRISELKTTKRGELHKGNKKIGAYYTPENVTRYISENTIWPYLRDKLNIDRGYKNFDMFWEKNKDDKRLLSRLCDELEQIRILDPAVGSGAFLMSAGELLANWRQKCNDMKDHEYDTRKRIIMDNLYGVDIMEGAVDICKLRLWLWLISGAGNTIEPLPNIDYNICCGNSLIGFVELHQFASLKQEKKKKKKVWRNLKNRYYMLEDYGEDSILDLFKERNKLVREYKTTTGREEERIRKELRELTDDFNQKLNRKLLQGTDENQLSKRDLKLIKPFHWVMEFSDVFEKGGFDVIVGNPPYGNILKENEELFMTDNVTSSIREIAANFVERGIYLLVPGGFLGNITTLGLVYRGDISHFHDFIRNNSRDIRIACFERRPCQMFRNAQIQVGIVILHKRKGHGNHSETRTSKFIRFNKSERAKMLTDISFMSVEGLILRDRIDGKDMSYQLLPKVGEKELYSVLVKLREKSSRVVKDTLSSETEHILYRQRGGGYRPIAMLEKLYESGEIQPIGFSTELERDTVFLIVNSSLFYVFWMAYGDARHVNTGQISRFPIPPLSILKRHHERITDLSKKLWPLMQEVFDETRNYFYMSRNRDFLGEVDDFLGLLYELTEREVKYVKSYDSKYIWTKSGS